MTEINPHPDVSRYPKSKNRSLKAWNAADEYLLKYLSQLDVAAPSVAIYNDRFGFLSCALHNTGPVNVVDYKSSEKAINRNLKNNGLDVNRSLFLSSLSPLPRPIDIGIIKIPKSLDLFHFYLDKLTEGLAENGIAICGFMTRHFSKQIPVVGGEFFEEVNQSLAWKKSRLLILKKKKPLQKSSAVRFFTHTFTTGLTEEVRQYPGVFSAGKVDYATQFLLEHTEVNDHDMKILDLASGNGVIARDIQLRKPDAEIHLLDDYYLAIESSRLNLDKDRIHFHFNDSPGRIVPKASLGENHFFDLVISNPPFHFGHENNIEITIRLFEQVKKVMKEGGRFLCVANKHLNYKTHLRKLFRETKTVAENDKYVIYQTKK
ncbi:MAG: methyltransferase [Balneolaceae bacterium]